MPPRISIIGIAQERARQAILTQETRLALIPESIGSEKKALADFGQRPDAMSVKIDLFRLFSSNPEASLFHENHPLGCREAWRLE
jgi:hypothetical protein